MSPLLAAEPQKLFLQQHISGGQSDDGKPEARKGIVAVCAGIGSHLHQSLESREAFL